MPEIELVKSLSDIEKDRQVSSLAESIAMLATEANGLDVVTDETVPQATDIRLKLQSAAKEIETRRKFFVEPHNQFVKTINAWFKKPAEIADTALKGLNRALVAYSDKKEADQREAERKILADQRTKPETKSEKLADVEQAPKTMTSSAGQIKFRIDKKLEIFSPYDVPREYCVPSPQLIELALNAGHEVRGARFIEVKTPVGRAN